MVDAGPEPTYAEQMRVPPPPPGQTGWLDLEMMILFTSQSRMFSTGV